jgi:hypothetical protein
VRLRLRKQHQLIFDIGDQIRYFWPLLPRCMHTGFEKDRFLRLVYVSSPEYNHMQMKSLRSNCTRIHAVLVGRRRSRSVVVGRGLHNGASPEPQIDGSLLVMLADRRVSTCAAMEAR